MNYPTVCVNIRVRIYAFSNEPIAKQEDGTVSFVIEGDIEQVNKILYETSRLPFYEKCEIIEAISIIHNL